MADFHKPVTLSSAGAGLAVIRDRVFAVLLPDPRPATWNFTEVADGYRIQDAATGNFLALPEGYDNGEGNTLGGLYQAVASSSDPGTPNSTWSVTELEADSGWYVIALAGTDWHLGRNNIEDRSLMPKAICAGDEGRVSEYIVIRES